MTGTALARYETARAELAACVRIDEAKDLRDRAEAMRLYARQAGDAELQAMALEIRMRAERRLGELIRAAKAAGELSRGGRPKTCTDAEQVSAVTLPELGIDRKLSARAQRQASVSERAFEMMVQATRERLAAGRARVVETGPSASTLAKQAARAEREQRLAERQIALPERRYGVILADPEWRFEPWSRATGLDRAADNHYPTSATEVIAARDVPSIAAPDCVLLLWATVPMLPQALLVMGAWGFDYRTQFVWVKDRVGTGYWNRNRHELLLLGVRGEVPAPAPGTQWPSAIEAPVGAHSAKPGAFLDLIDAYFPRLPKIELNRRGAPRPGWDAWGNEVTPADAAGRPLTADADGVVIEVAPAEAADVARTPVDDPLDLPDFLRRVPREAGVTS